MKAKGKAATIDIVCNILSPFAEPTINDNANADCIIPHTNFLELGGFKSPLCDSIPNTNVAEFADVMKNVNNSAIAITDITFPNVMLLITIKKAVEAFFEASIRNYLATEKSMAPNIENQKNETIDGTIRTPLINSFIVRPFEILAIKVPVNGAHAIHHAQ